VAIAAAGFALPENAVAAWECAAITRKSVVASGGYCSAGPALISGGLRAMITKI
jgi:hypothetical protein